MGRPAFTRFLTTDREGSVRWGERTASWRTLLAQGQERSRQVRPQGSYLVDPSVGMEALISLFAVATVPDTILLWSAADGIPRKELAPGLYEVDSPLPGPIDRPMWGVATSGSSGTPKLAIGHADVWELIALHYESAMFRPAFGGGTPTTLATCLPLQFSAAFFMTVLPAMFLQRDLLIFPAHNWRPVQQVASEHEVFVLGVPALAAAACLNTDEPVDMSRAALFLGGGHVSESRVRLIERHFTGISIANLYGTAETGAISVDYRPGHNRHVGRPIPGKAVWLEEVSEHGVGKVTVAAPDCCQFIWTPGHDPVPTAGRVASTDYGRFDDEGNLCLEGRVDGGEKLRGILVYPRAIERHLLTLDGVADARVLVQRTEAGLEHLLAKVVGEVAEAAVREHCLALAEIERPTRIECVSEQQAATVYSANGKL
ncbi:AMP-binding protein [Nonomuraea sp. NPDC049400]|uniref:AMP-binding protein n=1 Tax=Nonomuraea sp. NPDC049400 TaxID=3364352 RepID=UPI0037A2B9D4